MSQFLGIDLGTTFTQAAISSRNMFSLDPSELKCEFVRFKGTVPSKFPSVIFIPRIDATDEEWVVGSEAEKFRKSLPLQVITESKSALSQEQIYRRSMSVYFEISSDSIKIPAKKAAEIILKRALASMVDVNFSSIEACTITYPASFPDHALEQTMHAAGNVSFLADLNEKGSLFFLPEPIAAFLGYVNRKENLAKFREGDEILVIDVGAGTTDFTVLNIQSLAGSVPTIEINEVGPHLLLAGNLFDRIIAEYLSEKLHPEKLSELEFTQRFNQNNVNQFSYYLALIACEIKEQLDVYDEIETVNIVDDFPYQECQPIIDDFLSRLDRPHDYEIELDKREIESRLWKRFNAQIGLSIRAKLNELAARYSSSNDNKKLNPDYILVAGGSSALSVLRQYIASYFNLTPDSERILYDISPEHLISKGAAVYSSYSAQEREKLKWPINDNIYLLIDQNSVKSWDLIWDRKDRGLDFNDSRYMIESMSSKSAGYIELKFGRGYYDPIQKIDRVRVIERKKITLKGTVSDATPIILKRDFRNKVFVFDLYIPELNQKETFRFEVT